MIQEFRFNQYCERLQNYISRTLNEEFKRFLRWRGFNIDAGLFDISLTPPQNFASYREVEMDSSRVQTFTALVALPYMSTRFALKRFLGLSEEEIKQNQVLWREERMDTEDPAAKGSDLRSVGISTGDIDSDLETGEGMADTGGEDLGQEPTEVTAPVSSPDLGGGIPPAP
jgi:hypothetical protein